MGQLETNVQTDEWIPATWEEYLVAIAQPDYAHARGYYHNGLMRLEMTPLGNPHSRDHASVMGFLYLFVGCRGLDLDAHDNCTYRKSGLAEAQPDLSFYIGDHANK